MYKREVGKGGLLLMTSLRVRDEVFTIEQQIDKSLLTDEKDKIAYHGIIYDFGIAIGSGRLYMDDDGEYHIGRVAIMKEHRGKGLGKDLMNGLIEKAWEIGAEKVVIHSQEHAIPFYRSLGFIGKGDIFVEANIPHLEMEVLKS